MSLSDTLRQTALSIFQTVNDRDLPAMGKLLSRNVHIDHEEGPPHTSRDDFVSAGEQLLAAYPNFRFDIKESVVDEAQRKVWLFMDIHGFLGGEGDVVANVDMMTFGEEDGKWVLTKASDFQKIVPKKV